MRLTRNGWAAIVVTAIAALVGRLLGLTELFVLAAGGAVTIGLTALVVATASVRLEVGRDVRPQRVPVDSVCEVSLRIRNRGSRATPVLTLVDPVGDGQQSRLRLAPLPAGATRLSRYRLPVRRRGVITIGPMRASITDPLELWRSTLTTKSSIDVIVLPRIHELVPLPSAPGDEPDTGMHHLRTLATANEEFASLRDYRPGDDVRKVHWPSTARAGVPVVRHYDEPWQRRTTIVLDLRIGHYDEDSFERAVSAAASVVRLCADRGELVRLITTSGHDTGFLGSEHEVEASLDLLATVAMTGSGTLTGTLRALVHRRGGGALVTCTGPLGQSERSVLASMGTRFAVHLAVCAADRPDALAGLGGPSTAIAVVRDDGELSRSWQQAIDQLRITSAAGAR